MKYINLSKVVKIRYDISSMDITKSRRFFSHRLCSVIDLPPEI